ncbi:hypothetical protein PR048_013930 [Dryococelus australis]|uniref:Uncharacterized protein n=1 Tax=Dryococelus australis TaxID=614101 RepID=A0ABQ9HTL8_9NEOP|nr:hypothetical protein PR048_013930 [Dryococelus australis]
MERHVHMDCVYLIQTYSLIPKQMLGETQTCWCCFAWTTRIYVTFTTILIVRTYGFDQFIADCREGSSTGSQQVMSSIPPATAIGTDSADDYNEIVNAKAGMIESVCTEQTLARRSREVDELQNKRPSALNTDEYATPATKKSKLDIEDEAALMMTMTNSDSVEADEDSLDIFTYFPKHFPSPRDVNKAEDASYTDYIFPEDPNKLLDILRYLLELQKCGDFSKMKEKVSIIRGLKDRWIHDVMQPKEGERPWYLALEQRLVTSAKRKKSCFILSFFESQITAAGIGRKPMSIEFSDLGFRRRDERTAAGARQVVAVHAFSTHPNVHLDKNTTNKTSVYLKHARRRRPPSETLHYQNKKAYREDLPACPHSFSPSMNEKRRIYNKGHTGARYKSYAKAFEIVPVSRNLVAAGRAIRDQQAGLKHRCCVQFAGDNLGPISYPLRRSERPANDDLVWRGVTCFISRICGPLPPPTLGYVSWIDFPAGRMAPLHGGRETGWQGRENGSSAWRQRNGLASQGEWLLCMEAEKRAGKPGRMAPLHGGRETGWQGRENDSSAWKQRNGLARQGEWLLCMEAEKRAGKAGRVAPLHGGRETGWQGRESGSSAWRQRNGLARQGEWLLCMEAEKRAGKAGRVAPLHGGRETGWQGRESGSSAWRQRNGLARQGEWLLCMEAEKRAGKTGRVAPLHGGRETGWQGRESGSSALRQRNGLARQGEWLLCMEAEKRAGKAGRVAPLHGGRETGWQGRENGSSAWRQRNGLARQGEWLLCMEAEKRAGKAGRVAPLHGGRETGWQGRESGSSAWMQRNGLARQGEWLLCMEAEKRAGKAVRMAPLHGGRETGWQGRENGSSAWRQRNGLARQGEWLLCMEAEKRAGKAGRVAPLHGGRETGWQGRESGSSAWRQRNGLARQGEWLLCMEAEKCSEGQRGRSYVVAGNLDVTAHICFKVTAKVSEYAVCPGGASNKPLPSWVSLSEAASSDSRAAGWSFRGIARHLKRPVYTVSGRWTQWGQEGSHPRREGSGRPQKTSSREYRFVVRQAVITPRVSLCIIQGHVTAAGDTPVSISIVYTISRLLTGRDMSSRCSLRRLPLRPEHRQAHVTFCRELAVCQLAD